MASEYQWNLLIVQVILIAWLLGIVLWFIKVNSAASLEKRFKRFCIEPIHNYEPAIMDKLRSYYYAKKEKIIKYLMKSKLLLDYSKKYEIYVDKSRVIRKQGMDFIATKFVIGLLGIILIVLSNVLRYESITLMQIMLGFLLGFFAPDIYWKSREKIRRIQLEKDMLKAIIIMNNSFKSGLSIMQAIYMVSDELEGPISDEFRKMYIDINFGLDMDLVFARFASRVNTEEAHYITTSLSVLNKTGGNIVQVFASVERNAFTRKKLKEELDALSASANAIYRILISIPVLLTAAILLLNPSYFSPLFQTSYGRWILALILLIYVSYIVIIRRIVKMKE